jgi:hypothetical protein
MNSKNATRLKLQIPSVPPRGFAMTFMGFAFAGISAIAQATHGVYPKNVVKIFVDPDIRVSYDGEVPHMEAYIAASATNSDLLVAGGELIVPGRALSATEARLYRSNDAGVRWTPVLLPDEVNGGWDNAVAGGLGGVLYFLTSDLEAGLTVYRTQDGGRTWASTVLKAADG